MEKEEEQEDRRERGMTCRGKLRRMRRVRDYYQFQTHHISRLPSDPSMKV